ncbi:hypothetical protein DFH94DRAFT_801512 [Russula ochroleuca]|uniref:Fungal STAND N-terminal Goodbye domain-containing protein n=1 Tax=Russula ochroleuca TaxID=152965 RepID=A0A9P5MT16_9AGAM|nr:hypothetical protein DFH94DRAFT_801512 [Russula ochroleuca]
MLLHDGGYVVVQERRESKEKTEAVGRKGKKENLWVSSLWLAIGADEGRGAGVTKPINLFAFLLLTTFIIGYQVFCAPILLSAISDIPGNNSPRATPANYLPGIPHRHLSTNKLFSSAHMSHSHLAAASSWNFQLIINNALDAYKKRTKNDLLAHPLAPQLQACDSPGAILAVLQQQVQGLDQSRSDDRWTKWLDPTINVLFAFSSTLGAGVGLVFSPASVIFAGIGVLLSAAKDVRASQDTLMDIFERIETFFRRLEVYAGVALTTEMMDTIILIMVEVLSILGIATREIRRGRMSE